MFIGIYIFLLQVIAALLWKEMVNLFSWLNLMREDAQYKVLFEYLHPLPLGYVQCSSLSLSPHISPRGGTGEQPQAVLEMCPWQATQGLKCLWLLLPPLDLLPYFFHLCHHRILQSHNSDNFPCASQLTPNLGSLAGGSFVAAQSSIDMALRKGQQLTWDKNKPTPTHMRREEKNTSPITTLSAIFKKPLEI